MDAKILSELVKELALCQGAVAVGISTVETLAGGPPSTDLSYVLPGAKSAVTFAIPFDQELIEPYLSKKDHGTLERHIFHTGSACSGVALDIAGYLEMKGHPSVGLNHNAVYRRDKDPRGLDQMPDIAHRYLAVRSGVGYFGLSGNVITDPYGSAVLLGTAVTTAELVATEPLPPEDNYCDECKLCLSLCLSGFMSKEEKQSVTLGGLEYSHSMRRDYDRCNFVCGGFSGLHPSGKWSTWSPGRFPIPEEDDKFHEALVKVYPLYGARPELEGGTIHPHMRAKIHMSCANCQLVCTPDKEVRKKRYKMVTKSGVVIQQADGSLQAVSPDDARDHVSGLAEDQQRLYQEV